MKSITTPTQEEFQRVNDFWNLHIASGFAFSVDIAGKTHIFSDSNPVSTDIAHKDGNTVCVRTYRIGQLLIRQEAVLYSDLPIAEWTLFVKNDSDSITPKISFTAFDGQFPAGNATLYRSHGSDSRADDFMAFTDSLCYQKTITVAPYGGRSTNHEWPYFSVALGDYGVNLAIGWLGQWEAKFKRNNGVELSVRQQRLNSVMLPGEEFRSPRIVLQFWENAGLSEQKAVRRSQNIFRKYMRKYNMPRYSDGTVPTHGLVACSSHQLLEMTRATSQSQKDFIDAYEKRGIKLDSWWMDAGWYEGGDSDWCQLGTWRHDPARFPNGLGEVSSYAKSKGLGTVLWHEPERIRKGSELFEEHQDFLLSPVYPDGTSKADPDYRLFNFGDDKAREWITERISSNLTEYGVTTYRQDFNTEMLNFIDPSETEERKGAIENHYVCGMLKYWDDLAAQHPGLMLDECASGGRRDDIDAMKRALVFIRSDYLFEPASQQCHTGWLSAWLPFHGTGIMLGKSLIDNKQIDSTYDHYALMSSMSPHLNSCFDPRDDSLEWDKIKRLFDDWKEFAELYSGDYYNLTDITLDNSKWVAWQFNRFEEGDGFIQAFRRPECPEDERVFALNDLEPDALYSFHRYDDNSDFTMTGKAAMTGIKIALDIREATVIKYKKI